MSDSGKTGRTIDGHTFTDAPVDVKLGPNTFRIPANYLDSQIAPWPGEGVTLVIEWPDMVATEPGARVHPRTNDFRREIKALVNYVDRVPVETLLDRYASNEATTSPDSVERGDPSNRLDLRVAQPDVMGLTPYGIDEARMLTYAKAYEAKYGQPPIRNPRFEQDWFVARAPTGQVSTFIKCDSKFFRAEDGIRLEGRELVDVPGHDVASCVHYISDVENKLSFSLNYKRAFLKDWRKIEETFRELLTSTKVR